MAPRLSAEKRTRRLLIGIQHARQRLIACLARPSADPAAQAALAVLQREVEGFVPTLSARAVREQADIIESELELIQRMEQRTAAC